MPSSKKQKLSKEEKARRKVKSHSSKDPMPSHNDGDWSRKGDSRAFKCGGKLGIKNCCINDNFSRLLEGGNSGLASKYHRVNGGICVETES